MTQEAFVQVAPDSTGKKIRNIKIQTLLDPGDGSGAVLTDVYMQVTTIVDEQGNAINDFIDYQWQREVLLELQAIRRGIESMTGERHYSHEQEAH